MSKRANVGNASDAGQVRDAKRKERLALRQWQDDIRAVSSTPAGERFLRGVLDHVGTFRSIWHPSAVIHFNAGQQDVGHWLMKEIGTAAPDALTRITLAAYTADADDTDTENTQEDDADGKE